jgi:hypothetical protein
MNNMKSKDNSIIEFLALADASQSDISSVRSMLMGISYSDKIWQNPTITDSSVTDNDLGLEVHIEKEDLGIGGSSAAFKVTIQGADTDKVQDFESKLVHHIQEKLGFPKCSVLVHESSDKIAAEIQPIILGLENKLRTALGTYFLKTVGVEWWEATASKNVKEKVQSRSGLLQVDALLNANLTLTDAYDLGELLDATDHKEFSADWTNVLLLKAKLDFQYPFTNDDLQSAKSLAKSVTSIINQLTSGKFKNIASAENPVVEKKETPVAEKPVKKEAPKKVEAVKTDAPKKEEPVKKAAPAKKEVVKDDDFGFKIISEKELLKEISEAIESASGDLDLRTFIKEVSGVKGYAKGPTYSLAKSLNEKGLIELYDGKDESGGTIEAVKTV